MKFNSTIEILVNGTLVQSGCCKVDCNHIKIKGKEFKILT